MALGTLLGGLLGITQGLLGTGSRQEEMSQSRMQFRPEDLVSILNQRAAVQGGTQNLLDQLRQSQQAVTSQFMMPTTGFQFGQTPDALTRALAATGAQGLSQQTAAQQRQIAQQFRGEPGAARALQSQAMIASRLQQNPLLMQAMQQQQGRELAQAQQQQAEIQAANQALLNREQALMGLSSAGLGAQQNLLQTLLTLGQNLGTTVSSGSQRGRSNYLIG